MHNGTIYVSPYGKGLAVVAMLWLWLLLWGLGLLLMPQHGMHAMDWNR